MKGDDELRAQGRKHVMHWQCDFVGVGDNQRGERTWYLCIRPRSPEHDDHYTDIARRWGPDGVAVSMDGPSLPFKDAGGNQI